MAMKMFAQRYWNAAGTIQRVMPVNVFGGDGTFEPVNVEFSKTPPRVGSRIGRFVRPQGVDYKLPVSRHILPQSGKFGQRRFGIGVDENLCAYRTRADHTPQEFNTFAQSAEPQSRNISFEADGRVQVKQHCNWLFSPAC